MIPRYRRKEMASIWELENKYKIWLEIEILVCEALAKYRVISIEAAKNIRAKASFNIERIAEIEADTKHDVIAFLTNVGEYIGEDARFLHLGMTSSDLLDTCLAMQLTQASNIIIKNIEELLIVLKKRAIESKNYISMGRSHGVHAEPITFGLKFASFYAEFKRNLLRLKHAQEEIAVCAISGAVGTYANIDPKVEEYVAEKLGLKVETISTQIIPRDRHAMFFSTLAVIASSIERIATEIRLLQRTELREVEEYFAENQKGSSAMPHKKNPILSENLCGLARMIRSFAMPALENVTLWHERDISHSAVERFIAPDATITLDFALSRLTKLIEELVLYPQQMIKNFEQSFGLIYSQKILLALTEKGMSREEAYKLVQSKAMISWQNQQDFKQLLHQVPQIKSYFSDAEFEELFDINYHLKHINYIFDKVFA
jgi:adenylosuccinate lyase